MKLYTGTKFKSGQAVLDLEAEANFFALCFLIPEKPFIELLNQFPIEPSDDHNAKELAKRFEVSITAIVIRWVMLSEKINNKNHVPL